VIATMSAPGTVALVEATVMFSPVSAVLTADQPEFSLCGLIPGCLRVAVR